MSAEGASLVDTNVLVYAFDSSEPERSALAADLISRLIDQDALRLSTQVLKEFYVTVTRKIKKPLSSEEAIRILDDLSEWPVVAMIREAARLGTRSQISFWDALILVAAQRAECRWVFSEDLNYGQFIEGIELVNPFARSSPT